MSIRILLVDDHAIFMEGLRSLIGKDPETVVVGEATNGADALRQTDELKPDLVVMDLNMPVMNGIDATREIVARHPGTRVLILSMETDRFNVVQSIKSGASGYILKDSAFGELSEAIHAVSRGETYLPQKIAALVVKEFLQSVPSELSPVYDTLTPREREILQLIADGKTSKEIALHIGTSSKTVDNQRTALMQKLNLFSIAQLTKFAVRIGLSSLRK